MLDVLAVGDAIIDAFLSIHDADLHCHVDEKKRELCIPYGEKVLLDNCNFLLGGNACNVSVGLSRLGHKTGLCAEIGDDELSEKILHGLAKEHIDQSFLTKTPGAASSFAVGITFQGERTLFVEHVIRRHDFHLPSTPVQWVYLSSMGKEWKQAYEKTLVFVRAEKAKLAFNPGTPQITEGREGIREVLAATDILFVNKEEGERIIGASVPQTKILLVALQSFGPKIVVVTDGKKGSYVLDEKNRYYHIGIVDHPVVERTGAGDAYTSGFLSAVIYKRSIPEAMLWGTCNAASVVGKIGAQEGLLHRAEMEKELQSFSHLSLR